MEEWSGTFIYAQIKSYQDLVRRSVVDWVVMVCHSLKVDPQENSLRHTGVEDLHHFYLNSSTCTNDYDGVFICMCVCALLL